MEKEKLERINFLARESKLRELSDAEKAEQNELRQEYIREFRASFGAQLHNTVVQYPDGTKKRMTELGNGKKD